MPARTLRTILLPLLMMSAIACGMGSSSTAPFDRQFIDMMAPHHQGAVEMVKIAQERGEHQEIKQMAVAIV